MAKRPHLLFANDRNAAALLDMNPAEFRGLVNDGVLPKPLNTGGLERWDVEQLQAIMRGDAADGMGEVNW